MLNLIEKLKKEIIVINRQFGKPLATMNRTIDISTDIQILQQAQKIINKYDIDTKKDEEYTDAHSHDYRG